MSTADRRPVSASQAGYTFVETFIVLIMIVSVAVVLNGALSSTTDTDRYLQAVRTATEKSQKISLELSSLVGSSRKLFTGDDVGKAYLAALDLSRLPVAAASRLPTLAEDEVMGEDEVGEPRTGNVLLFVREADPIPAVADPLLGTLRNIDTYRFVAVYPQATTATLVPNRPPARDLVVWKSVPFPSWQALNDVVDLTQRKNVVKDLYKRFGHRYAWDPEQTADAAFFALDAVGNVSATPKVPFKVAEDTVLSDGGRLVYARISLARSDPDSAIARAVLTGDAPNVWSPDGFEVKVVGASKSRSVWIHLVLEVGENGGQKTAMQGATVIATCQDL